MPLSRVRDGVKAHSVGRPHDGLTHELMEASPSAGGSLESWSSAARVCLLGRESLPHTVALLGELSRAPVASHRGWQAFILLRGHPLQLSEMRLQLSRLPLLICI